MYNRIGSKPDFKIKPPRFLNFEMLLPKLKSHPKEGKKKTPTLLLTTFF
jgi:hypothetical protein